MEKEKEDENEEKKKRKREETPAENLSKISKKRKTTTPSEQLPKYKPKTSENYQIFSEDSKKLERYVRNNEINDFKKYI